MTMRAQAFTLLLISILVPPLTQAGGTPNTLQNGDFETNLDHWSCGIDPDVLFNWSSIDRDDQPDSGSLEMTAMNGGLEHCFQCVTADPGAGYFFGWSHLIDDNPNGVLRLQIDYFSDTSCNTNTGDQFITAFGTDPGDLFIWQDELRLLNAPINARSMRVLYSIFHDPMSPIVLYTGHIDQVWREKDLLWENDFDPNF